MVTLDNSRVDGSSPSGSDLDSAVIRDVDISLLKAAPENSNVQFLVDVLKFHNLPLRFSKF